MLSATSPVNWTSSCSAFSSQTHRECGSLMWLLPLPSGLMDGPCSQAHAGYPWEGHSTMHFFQLCLEHSRSWEDRHLGGVMKALAKSAARDDEQEAKKALSKELNTQK
jgi:hypothetical protein